MKNEKIIRNLLALAILPLFVLACSIFGGGSPTSVFKNFVAAAQKKDTSTMKKYLSDDALANIRKASQSGGKSEDEILSMASEKFAEMPTISNEKIENDGKTASVEIKTKADKTDTIYFVKEGDWKLNFEKPKENPAETVKTTPDASPGGNDPKETGPVTISATALLEEAKISGSGMDAKYGGRMITVTGAELWEIQSSMLHIGAKSGSYSSGYIICSGSFSEYMPYASKISDLKRNGKSPGASIKGSFSKVSMDSGYTQIHLDPCVLSDLEKP